MQIDVQPGRYVVAVSGGVDSMVLLDILKNQAGLDLIVAHFDHGIREDSVEDRKLVEHVATQLKLPFVYEEGRLGQEVSEAEARAARYAFLERVRMERGAQAIMTAHHVDDVLETAILNILRGTGRKGLTSLSSRSTVVRPLLSTKKRVIRQYAIEHGVAWREDSTNTEERYLRNYIRLNILSRFDADSKRTLLGIIEQARTTNKELDEVLRGLVPVSNELDRKFVVSLPHDIAKEFLASWLRAKGVAGFDERTLERLVVAAKIQRSGATIDIIGRAKLVVGKGKLALVRPER